MLYQSEKMEDMAVLQTAARMCAAVRTAPKAHGKDTLYTIVLTGEDKEKLVQIMEKIGQREMGEKMNTWYGRDAANVRASQAVVLVGSDKKYRGVPHCGYCGFSDCGSCKRAGGNCAYIYIDLGIAVSSAVTTAAIDKVDNRIMLSVGKAAAEMELISDTIWLGVPISVSGKNVFFDRGVTHE